MHAFSSCNPVLKPCTPKGIACLYRNDKNTIVTLPTPPIEYLSQQPSGPCKSEWFAGFIEFLEFNKWHNERMLLCL